MYMLGGMSDTASNRITFERDSQYRITCVSHTDGIRLKLTYHASGYLKAIHRTDNGIQTLATYEQDARGAADRSGCAAGLPPVFMSTTLRTGSSAGPITTRRGARGKIM
ncbi:hypothetical protein KZ773_18655 [Escherichia coli]|nr:hypothetical protein [Escherichia coli]